MAKKELETVVQDSANSSAPVLEFPGLSDIASEERDEFSAAGEAQDQAAAEEAQVEQETNVEGWTKAVAMAGDVICSMFPEASPVWNKERVSNLGAALARCDEHYDWGGVGGLLGNPLIGLAFAGFPVIAGTAKAIKAKREKDTLDLELREVKPAAPGADPMAAAAGGAPATVA
jgi:hypothetical protein